MVQSDGLMCSAPAQKVFFSQTIETRRQGSSGGGHQTESSRPFNQPETEMNVQITISWNLQQSKVM